MENRYARNFPALTEEQWNTLRTKTVAVIGCGGLGGYLAEFLARLGVGKIRCVDADVFEATNLNRQLLSTPSALGVNKAQSALDRIHAVNPQVEAEAFPVFLDEENARQLIAGCDAVLDGLDCIPSRRILARACAAEGIPYIYGAVSGWVAQAALCLPGDPLMDTLYPQESSDPQKSVLSFTPALCASLQTCLCVKQLTGRPVESGKLHHFDLLFEEYNGFSLK